MSAFLNQQLTNVGWDALSIALGGGRLTFYKMQAGQGTIANDAAIPPMTSLVTPVCDLAITSYLYEGDGQITLFANINSKDLDAGFTFRELGVFATIENPIAGKGGTPSGPNISAIAVTPGVTANPVVPPPAEGTALMYSYCNSYAASDYIPGSGETTAVTNTVQVTIKIDQAEDVQINILAGETFSVVNIGPPSVGAGVWSYTDANVAYLKRLVAGPMTDIHEDANTITIGQKQLTSDLDLYVANGNPDISPNFSSIQKALNYLAQYIIPTTVRARIHVSAGTYTSTTPILVDHPNSRSITIQGPQNTTRTGTSLSISGSAFAWNMAVNGISDTSQFVVNDWAIINHIGGTSTPSHGLACGMFKVLSKTASSVTVRVPNPEASFSMAGTNSIKITPISVLLTNSVVNTQVMRIGSYGIGLFQYVGIIPSAVPTLTMTVFSVGGTSNLKFIGVAGWQLGFNAQGNNQVNAFFVGADCGCDSCASTYNQSGFTVSGNGNLSLVGCAATYSTLRNIWVEGTGSVDFYREPTYVAGGWVLGSGAGEGIVLNNGGTGAIIAGIPPGYVFCHKNDGPGLLCLGGGMLAFSNTTCTLWLQGNQQSVATHYDVVVQNYGLVNGSVCIIGTRIFNSPVGTINSTGGLIN